MSGETSPPISVPALLKKYGIRPSKGLGQNFLVDDNSLRKVVNAADISKDDLILEVGPGLGSLTRYLGAAAKIVYAVELDKKLLPALHETLANFENVEIIVGDILELNPVDLIIGSENSDLPEKNQQTSYKVVANIPYYITSALIRHLLEADLKPSRMVLTIQKEVAQRICAQPPRMSLLALSVQVYGLPKIAAKISSGAFFPRPKVDSSVVVIELYSQPLIQDDLLLNFFQIAKAGFSQKRKTLRNTLSAGLHWPKELTETILLEADINPQRRAQTLSMKEWKTLTICTIQFL